MLELLVAGAWICLIPYSLWFFLSARKRERDHAKVQERFRGIYNSSKNAIVFGSLNGLLLDVNDSFCKLTGYSKEEILTKKRHQDITPKEYHEAEAKIIEGVLRTGKPAEYEKEYIRKDGSHVPIMITTFVVKGARSNPIGVAAIIKDISERQRMEEDSNRLFKAIEITKEAISITSSDAVICYTNNAMNELFGYKQGGLIGKHISILNAGRTPQTVTRQILGAVEKNGYWEGEIYNTRKDGTDFFCYAIVSAVKGEDGKTSNFISTQHDITERKLLQEKILKSEKLAVIGQLAASVSHEIRNPLGVIMNACYFLNIKLKDVADEKILKHLRIIEKKVKSANLIISDLLDFARNKPPILNETDLNELVISALSGIPKSKNIEVITKLGEIPPMPLDQEQIERVFQNLIQNAIQAMPKGGKLIIHTSKHDDSVEIAFLDTGAGIPQENVPKLFTPLFSTKAKGVGLGLSICKQIIEDHGGNIMVTSKENEGSIFTVKLPIHVNEKIREEPTSPIKVRIQESP